jgi:hypothetical protein
MGFGTKNRPPVWIYGVIAAVLIAILAAGWAHFDAVSRVELLIPVLFWSSAFVITSLRRRAARS